MSAHNKKKMAIISLAPLAGLLLLVTGFSTTGFLYAGVDHDSVMYKALAAADPGDDVASGTFEVTDMSSLGFFVFAGLTLAFNLLTAFMVLCKMRDMASLVLCTLAIISGLLGVAFGASVQYEAYETETPDGGVLYILTWVGQLLSLFVNLSVATLLTLKACSKPTAPPTATLPVSDVKPKVSRQTIANRR